MLPALFLVSLLAPAYAGEIHDAAIAGDVEKVRALLKKNPRSVNERNENGETPLHMAWPSPKVIELLLTNNADINARDRDGQTPLMAVTMVDALEAAELLIRSKADVKAKDNNGNTALHLAAGAGRKEIAELLMAHGAVVNATNDLIGGTPLHDAAQGDKPELIELLLKNKAEINAEDTTGQTPLHQAAYSGNLAAVKVLVTRGAAINLRDKNGITALGRALLRSQVDDAPARRVAADVAGLAAVHPVRRLGDVRQDVAPLAEERFVIDGIHRRHDRVGLQRGGIDRTRLELGCQILRERDAITHQLGDPAHHHPARAGADQDDILQILVEDELRDLVGLGFGGDAGTHRALALAAAVQGRGIDLMPRRAHPVRHALPDPAALKRAVHQYECCHRSIPSGYVDRRAGYESTFARDA